MGELRALGVTLVLDINEDREYVRDATVVYFIQPSKHNVDILAQDIIRELYFEYEIHFVERTERELLETLAKTILDATSPEKQEELLQKITCIKDEFLAFHCVEHDFFSLELNQMFYKVMHPQLQSKTEMENLLNRVANGLVCVVMAHGVMPIIAYEKGADSPATVIAKLVEKKLSDLYNSSNREIRQLFAGNVSKGTSSKRSLKRRPVLILADRTMDLSVSVQHRWSYRAMVHDIFKMKNNSVRVPVKEENEGGSEPVEKIRKYDIDPIHDTYWQQYAPKSFHDVASEVSNALATYEEQLKKFNKKTGLNISGEDMLSGDVDDKLESNVKLTKQVINEVFRLSDQRKHVDMHTNLAYSILDAITARKLDEFYALEEALIIHKPLDQKDQNVLQSLFDDSTKGTVHDKIRLLIICYLASISSKKSNYILPFTKDELMRYERRLQRQRLEEESKEIPESEDQLCLPELKYLRSLSLDEQAIFFDELKGRRDDRFAQIKSSMLSSFNVLGTQLKSIASNLRGGDDASFFPLPLTQLVHSIMNPEGLDPHHSSSMSNLTSSSVFQGSERYNGKYQFVDPKRSQSMGTNTTDNATGEFGEAIVFVFGGGNFLEYQNLLEFCELPNMRGKRVVYGSTSLLTGEEFVDELRKLGEAQE